MEDEEHGAQGNIDSSACVAPEVEQVENLDTDDPPTGGENDAGGENLVALLEIGRDADGATIFLQHDASETEGKQMCIVQNEEGQSFIIMVDGSESYTEQTICQSALMSHPHLFYIGNEKLNELTQGIVLTEVNEPSGNAEQNALVETIDLRENASISSLRTEADSVQSPENHENGHTTETKQIFIPTPSLLPSSSFAAVDLANCKLSTLASIAHALANQQTNCDVASKDDKNDALNSASESVLITHLYATGKDSSLSLADSVAATEDENDALTSASESVLITHFHATEKDSSLSLADRVAVTEDEKEMEINSLHNQMEANDFEAINAASCSSVETRTTNAVSVIYSPLSVNKIHSSNESASNSPSSLNIALKDNESHENMCNENERLIPNSSNQLTSDKSNHTNLETIVPLIQNTILESNMDGVCLDLSYKSSNIHEVNDESQLPIDNNENENTLLAIDNQCVGLKEANAFHVEENSGDDVNSCTESSGRDSYLVEKNKEKSEKDFFLDIKNSANNNLSTCGAENASIDVVDMTGSNIGDESVHNGSAHVPKQMTFSHSESVMKTAGIFNANNPAENHVGVNNMLLCDETNDIVPLRTDLPLPSKQNVNTINGADLETSCSLKNNCCLTSGKVYTTDSDSDFDKNDTLNNVQTPIFVAEPSCTDVDHDVKNISTALSPSISCSSIYNNSLQIKVINHDLEKHIEKISSYVQKDNCNVSSQAVASPDSINVTEALSSSILTSDSSTNGAEPSAEQAEIILNQRITDERLNEYLNAQKFTEDISKVNKALPISVLEDNESSNAGETSGLQNIIVKNSETVENFSNSNEVIESNSKSLETPILELKSNECVNSKKVPEGDGMIQNCLAKDSKLSQDFNNSTEVVNEGSVLSESSADILCRTETENAQEEIPMSVEVGFEHEKERMREHEQKANDSSGIARLEETSVRPPKKTYIKRKKTSTPALSPKLNLDKDKKIELFSCEELTDGIFSRNDEHNRTNDTVKHSTLPKDDDSTDDDDQSLLSGIKNKVSATYKRKKKTDNTRNLRSRSMSSTSTKHRSNDGLCVASDDQDNDENLKLQVVENENAESIYWGAYLMNTSFNSPENNTDLRTFSKSGATKKKLSFSSNKRHLSNFSKIENTKDFNQIIKSSPIKSKIMSRMGRQELRVKVKKQFMSLQKFKTVSAQKIRKPNIVKYRAIMKKYRTAKLRKKIVPRKLRKYLKEPTNFPRIGSPVEGTDERVIRICFIDEPRRNYENYKCQEDEPSDPEYSCSYCSHTTDVVDMIIDHMKTCEYRIQPNPPEETSDSVNDMELRQRIRGEQRDISGNGPTTNGYVNGTWYSFNGASNSSPSSPDHSCDHYRNRSGRLSEETCDFKEDSVVWARLLDRFWPGWVFKMDGKKAWILLINYFEGTKRIKMSPQTLISYTDPEFQQEILEEAARMAHYSQFMKAVQKAENYARKKGLGEVTSGKQFFKVSSEDEFDEESSISSMSESEDCPEGMVFDFLEDGNRENFVPDNITNIDDCRPKKSHFTEEEIKKLSQCILEGHCNDHLAAVYKGEADSMRHTYFFSQDKELIRKLKCMMWFGRVCIDQIQLLYDYLREEFRLTFGDEHHMVQYICEVWIPEALIKAISLVKDICLEDASKFFEDEALVLDHDRISLEHILTL